MIVGQRDYAMRFWVRPDKLAKLGLTGTDLANVISEQNLVAPAGQVGQPPAKAGTQFQYTVNVKGRLTDPAEFENMIVRTHPDGSILRMKDVSRAELSGKSYTSFGRKDGIPATVLIIYQLPGANAIQTVDNVRKLLDETRKNLPPGPGIPHLAGHHGVRQGGHHEVFHRPERRHHPRPDRRVHFPGKFPSHVHSHAGGARLAGRDLRRVRGARVFHQYAHHAGSGARGRHRGGRRHRGGGGRGTSHRTRPEPDAGHRKAMDEVSGPVMAIGLVLCAVFVPVSFMGGIVGQLYRQFAITISVSVILSVIVALTLTPALCQMMLRPRKQIRGPVGAFLRGFNKVFNKMTNGYLGGVGFFLRRAVIGLACLAGLWFGAGSLLMKLPTGFVPNEDQGYFFTVFNLPDGASMERTDQLMRRAEADLKSIPGVGEVLTTGGLNLLTNAYTSNNASIIIMLKPWDERKSEEEQLKAILMAARRKFAAYPEAISLVFPPPPINGLGNASGFVFELQDRTGRTPQELAAVKDKVHAGHGQAQ